MEESEIEYRPILGISQQEKKFINIEFLELVDKYTETPNIIG